MQEASDYCDYDHEIVCSKVGGRIGDHTLRSMDEYTICVEVGTYLSTVHGLYSMYYVRSRQDTSTVSIMYVYCSGSRIVTSDSLLVSILLYSVELTVTNIMILACHDLLQG